MMAIFSRSASSSGTSLTRPAARRVHGRSQPVHTRASWASRCPSPRVALWGAATPAATAACWRVSWPAIALTRHARTWVRGPGALWPLRQRQPQLRQCRASGTRRPPVALECSAVVRRPRGSGPSGRRRWLRSAKWPVPAPRRQRRQGAARCHRCSCTQRLCRRSWGTGSRPPRLSARARAEPRRGLAPGRASSSARGLRGRRSQAPARRRPTPVWSWLPTRGP
mmetsp:Transcript_33659/g.106930  ORF Transcript_33659/g.106930 Transcript_33659/m.106930 type:complete len:224 (-) Transcript_33659:301-972(-)